METKKISALLSAVEKGSLTSAAEELGYTQSGLTHMMNSLEEELGITLLVRSKTGVSLSPAGQKLLPHMHELMDAAGKLMTEAESLHQRSFSTIRLGAYSSVARQWLPYILAEFRRSSPDTEVKITMSGIQELYDATRQDQLDCAMVSLQEDMCQGLSWTSLKNDELVAVLPPNSSYEGSSFPLSNFSGRDFLMPSAGFDLDINPVFAAGDVQPNFRYTNLDDASIVSMVEHGLGVSILSELIMQGMPGNVKTLPLAPAGFRKLGIITGARRQNDKNIHRLVRCAEDTVKRLYSKKG